MARHDGPDRYKHETPRDRVERHQRDAQRGVVQPAGGNRPRPFDVATWDRMHREAEDATIFGIDQFGNWSNDR